MTHQLLGVALGIMVYEGQRAYSGQQNKQTFGCFQERDSADGVGQSHVQSRRESAAFYGRHNPGAK
ncbi:MAG: hypothetical protein OEY53_05955 [Gammaproteobacteria bacterium]|nr:hypothetical protein [Gammaproteobacteria bacterium]